MLLDALSRLVDPRAGLCLVWGHVSAGSARNAIPREGVLQGTLRVLDKGAWQEAPTLVRRVVDGLVAPYGARAEVSYERGVPRASGAETLPGLYFCGFYVAPTGMLREIAKDARKIARAIARHAR